MKINFTKLFLLLGVAFAAASCDGKKAPGGGEDVDSGVVGISKTEVSVGNVSRVFPITFVAFGDWTVKSDAAWCTISDDALSGKTGSGAITLNIAENVAPGDARTAIITISVVGFTDMKLTTVVQSKNGGTKGGRAVNRWMSDHLMGYYLWNGPFGMIEYKLDYDAEPVKFLTDALSTVVGNDDDGGYYANRERFFYSSLAQMLKPQSAPSRAEAGYGDGLGIQFVYPVDVENTGAKYYLLISSVYQNSPAATAKLCRGQYITKFNRAPITNNNINEVFAYAMGQAPISNAQLQISEYVKVNDNEYQLKDKGEVIVNGGKFSKSPIIFNAAAKMLGTEKTVGYLVLSEFDASHDDELIAVFTKFKSQGVTDLVLDLRYNGGGDVYSSTVLATLLLGEAYKGQVYSEMEFNQMRKQKGEQDFFYIGKEPTTGAYAPIIAALGSSLNLKSLHVIGTGFTASASELVINGLKGLDIPVYLLGETTEGKNVGMEVVESANPIYSDYDFGNYMYQFAPITFYNLNAKGFKDYGNGFTPDFEHNETSEIVFDWADGMTGKDMLFYAAFMHIKTGSWVTPQSATPTRTVGNKPTVVNDHRVLDQFRSKGLKVYPNSYYNN